MKNKIFVFVFVFVLLVLSSIAYTKDRNNIKFDTFYVGNSHNKVIRIVDYDYNIVCYKTWGNNGIFCLPLTKERNN